MTPIGVVRHDDGVAGNAAMLSSSADVIGRNGRRGVQVHNFHEGTALNSERGRHGLGGEVSVGADGGEAKGVSGRVGQHTPLPGGRLVFGECSTQCDSGLG